MGDTYFPKDGIEVPEPVFVVPLVEGEHSPGLQEEFILRRNVLPGGSALHLRRTSKGGLPLALSVEAADLVELEDVLTLCSHVKLAILEHEGGKVEHEPFGQLVLEGKPKLEIYCHKEDRYFCFLQRQELV